MEVERVAWREESVGAWRRVDLLLLAWMAFTSLVILLRGTSADPIYPSLLALHLAGACVLLVLVRIDDHPVAGALHDLAPFLFLIPFYTEIGILNRYLGAEAVLANDTRVQVWESAWFGGQPSYDWIRDYPSVFLSGLLHLAYLWYYPIVILGPIGLIACGRKLEARSVVLAVMTAFFSCYFIFVLFPVAGPYFAFDHPTGPAREVWSARIVYAILERGSAMGTGFPSSHVAATTASVLALWFTWRSLSWGLLVPAILLAVGTVYCQMHYAIDAILGMAVGCVAVWMVFGSSGARSRS